MANVGIRMRATHNDFEPWGGSVGSDGMRDRRDGEGPEDRRRGRGHRGDRSRRRRRRSRELTREERTLAEAQRRANLKLAFMTHFLTYASVCVFLLFVAGFRAAFIVALAWGIGIVAHFFGTHVAPDLRRRYVEREVNREIRDNAPVARRNLEDKHVRSLEELSASIAHEIRNPITAAKSLVQQMGEDPASDREPRIRRRLALSELDRVERSISHLLRYARDEEHRA